MDFANVRVVKRDGKIVPFNKVNISVAVKKAVMASHDNIDVNSSTANARNAQVVETVMGYIEQDLGKMNTIHVEKIQDLVERSLIKLGYADTAKEYILYRQRRNEIRNTRNKTAECIDEILNKDAKNSDLKRDNANINGDTAMGTMLQIGANVSKQYYLDNRINKTASTAHQDGYIHIHDLDFYDLTVTCCQIDIKKLFEGGFNTGHGFLREPNSIGTAASLAAIAIQSDQNDCHGGQSIPNFDYGLAKYVQKTFEKRFKERFNTLVDFTFGEYFATGIPDVLYDSSMDIMSKRGYINMERRMTNMFDPKKMREDSDTITEVAKYIYGFVDEDMIFSNVKKFVSRIMGQAWKDAIESTDHDTFQAMEGFIHNCNTLHSRAGAQVPFSSINLGTDTSVCGRMVTKNLLNALEKGLGHGETAIFPIVIFKVKEGVNYNKEDDNYDLLQLACQVTAKRLFPNFVFLDAPFNLQYYKPGHPETEVATMGCRTRVMGNHYDPENEVSYGRGNLSFTSINLPRLAIEANGSEEAFFRSLRQYMTIVKSQLLERFEIQAKRRVYNFPFLMGQGVWTKSDDLKWDDEVREVIKHGSLSIGFVGLAEAMVALYGHHHAEGEEYQEKALAIIKYMREVTDMFAEETGLNFTLLATPAESLAGRFLRMDRKKFGIIEGVTDKDFYTNSFHVPVQYNITAFEKIHIEAPYHALTNAGHISYIELDGDPAKNVRVIEKIIRCMHDEGIGYGSINHPVDRDPVCGFTGIIGDECPCCGRKESEDHIPFERIRRITGYLVGDLSRWNNAKRAEEAMRVKHGTNN